jgi:hypothetical protein
MGKIMLSKGTKTTILIVAVVVLFGGSMVAMGTGIGEFIAAIWKKFLNLLSGNI